MRIFLAISHSPNGVHIPSSTLWLVNLYLPLIELGHEVERLDYDFQRLIDFGDDPEVIHRHRPLFCENLLRQLLEAHRKKPIDLFFSYFYDSCITPEVIQEIKRLGIITLNFSCNNIHQFHLVERLAAFYDYCMVPERGALGKFRAVGGNPLHVQLGANPEVYKPYPIVREFDVTFVGQKYADRQDYIYHLFKNGADIKVWGAGWKHEQSGLDIKRVIRKIVSPRKVFSFLKSKTIELKNLRRDRSMDKVCFPPLSDEELIKMYSRSKISLGFSKVIDPKNPRRFLRHLRLRDFEAPMSGAFYLAEYTPELEEYYKVGEEIVCYSCQEELLEKVRYFLSHPGEIEKIRRAGYERALKDHTWIKRFRQLFSSIKAS